MKRIFRLDCSVSAALLPMAPRELPTSWSQVTGHRIIAYRRAGLFWLYFT